MRKEKHVTVHGHSMPAHCNKKHTTRKNLVMCGNHAFEILPSCRLPAVFLQKSLFLIKTLCSGMQFDREIVEHEPGLGGVGEGGVKVL